MSFLNIMLCYYFSLGLVLQGMAKNNPNEKTHRCRNSGDIEAGKIKVSVATLSMYLFAGKSILGLEYY